LRVDTFSGQIDPQFNPFAESYVRDIIRAIALAWSRRRNPPADEIEDRITFRLAGRLQNDEDFRELPFDVVPQYWLLDLHGRRLGRLDLRFKHMQSRRDYFAFEAKRLHVAYPSGFKAEHSVYVGDEGMMCFVTGKYSAGLSHAGMLAYVMDNDVLRAWKGLSDAIENNRNALKLRNGASFIASVFDDMITTIIATARVVETAHEFGDGPMVITHILLPRET
jgi:hypothetical protein